MALNFPWEMFLQAQQARTQNQRNMYGDIAGLGQGLGEGMASVGAALKQQRLQKVIDGMLNPPPQPPPVPTMAENTAQQSLPSEHPAGAQPQTGTSFDPMKLAMGALSADPSLVKEFLPTMVAAYYKHKTDGALTPYQLLNANFHQQSLGLQGRRIKDMEDYQSTLEQLRGFQLSLEKKGLFQKATQMKGIIANITNNHYPWMYQMGLMQSPWEASGVGNLEEEDGGEDFSTKSEAELRRIAGQ